MSRSETFRAGVGAVVGHASGLVLAFEREARPGSWQFPQGGIDVDEAVEAALWRELWEETGLGPSHVRMVSEVPVWLGYEHPAEYQTAKSRRGQTHRWFILSASSLELPIDLGASGDPEFQAWQWMTPESVIEHAIEFRRPVYRFLMAHLATVAGL